MKTFKNLYKQMIDPDVVRQAIINAAKRKLDRGDVRYIVDNIEEHICNVIEILENLSFKPQTHSIMVINDGVTHKKRDIIQPYFFRNQYGEAVYEQVIQHIAVIVLTPLFKRGMYYESNGSIPERGCHVGKKHLEKFIKENADTGKIKYFLKADIHHFYQSINIDILKQLLTKKIKDDKCLNIIFAILDSNIALKKKQKINMGLPIGFYSSQWFANFLLENFDRYIKQELKADFYSRYMDDFLIFGPNKKELQKKLEKIKQHLWENYGLTLKETSKVAQFDYFNKKQNKRVGECIDFMGFKFYRDRTVLRKHIIKSALKAAKHIHKSVINHEPINPHIASRLISYYGWFKHSNTKSYWNKYIAPIAHMSACKKVIQQRERHRHVPYWVKKVEVTRQVLNILHKQGERKYQELLKKKYCKIPA